MIRLAIGLALCLPLVACGESKSSGPPENAQVRPIHLADTVPGNSPVPAVEAPVADYLDNGMYWFPRATIGALKYAAPSATCTPRGSGTTCFAEQVVPDAWCMGLSPCHGGTFEFVNDRLIASSVRVSEAGLTRVLEETTAKYGPARSRIVDEPRIPTQSVHFAWKLDSNYLEIAQLGGVDLNGQRYRSQLVSIGPNPPVGIDFSAARPTALSSANISPVRGRVVLNPFENDAVETSAPPSERTTNTSDSVTTGANETSQ